MKKPISIELPTDEQLTAVQAGIGKAMMFLSNELEMIKWNVRYELDHQTFKGEEIPALFMYIKPNNSPHTVMCCCVSLRTLTHEYSEAMREMMSALSYIRRLIDS